MSFASEEKRTTMPEKTYDALYLLWSIVDRGQRRQVRRILGEHGQHLTFNIMGEGTARTELLDYLGLGDRKRDIVLAGVCGSQKRAVLRDLARRLRIAERGGGILFTLPMAAIGGARTLSIMRGDVPEDAECKGEKMQHSRAELIMTIVERGCAQDVVEAAQRVGAQGATVVHGRASSTAERRQFFGIMVEPQKDVVLLLVRTEVAADVMRAITTAAGLKTAGRGICFSLPVADVVGALGFSDTIEV